MPKFETVNGDVMEAKNTVAVVALKDVTIGSSVSGPTLMMNNVPLERKCAHCGVVCEPKSTIRYAGKEKVGHQVYAFERFCCGTVLCNNAVQQMYFKWRDGWRAKREVLNQSQDR